MNQTPHDESPLVRGLSAWDATALVAGTVIGSGVFLKAAVMAQAVATPFELIAAWIAAGILSLIGALTYAELGAMLPHAGGEYVYLKHSYGRAAAFFYGWGRFAVAGSASIAAIAAALAQFSNDIWNLGQPWFVIENVFGLNHTLTFGWEQVIAVGSILIISLLNCFAVSHGGKFQTIVTAVKIISVIAVAFGIFFFSSTASWSHFARPEDAKEYGGVYPFAAAFGLAMLAALWAYDGWNNMPMAAGEVRNPGRNVPLALIYGMLICMGAYCLINMAYIYALPYPDVASTRSDAYPDAPTIATRASQTFLGDSGARLMAIAFVISAFGALNGSILTSARIPYAMARDRLFFRSFGEVHAITRVPVIAVVIQAIWSSILALSGTFNQLTDCLLFVSWIFYGLVASAVIVLRFTQPNLPRPYKVWGYPVTPIIFVIIAACLTVNTYIELPGTSQAGLLILALGIPFYLYFLYTDRGADKAASPPE